MSEPLLDYREILSDFAMREMDSFFKGLPVVQRARFRWIFPEPNGVLGYPRQRVRRVSLRHGGRLARGVAR